MAASRGDASWRNPGQSGLTIIEAVIVLIIVATVVGALIPSMARQLSHARVNRAARVVAADFLLAQSLAGRQHAPITVTFSSTALTTTMATTSTTLVTRYFGVNSDFKLSAFSASPGAVQVLPNGMANQSVTVTVTAQGYSRQVKMTRAGLVRVL